MAQELPAFPSTSRILFQGDSITDGNRGRSVDPNHILGHGYAFIIASLSGGREPERDLTFLNRGVSGNKVSNLAIRWNKDTLDLKPDVLSILIGVNDLNDGISAEDYETQYDQLLAGTINALPKVKLILCEPFGLAVGPPANRWADYRAELGKRIAIVNRLGAKYHATVVHFQKAFEVATKRAPAEHWIWDGVHPTYSGHQIMADEWLKTVRELFPPVAPNLSATPAIAPTGTQR